MMDQLIPSGYKYLDFVLRTEKEKGLLRFQFSQVQVRAWMGYGMSVLETGKARREEKRK